MNNWKDLKHFHSFKEGNQQFRLINKISEIKDFKNVKEIENYSDLEWFQRHNFFVVSR